ncbi:hypothetical protein BU26DRAFT_514777 [Trematosphaeria pertusa]|uniref:Protein YAE1 n=1 Tax=Trematosphaeria pertusa TaxID=390896 RepID=A0A6A6IWL4_9PLEO|nr:uncharacterized protein BU26DRAFT_514777 [Trematosphaeria pertusa]KAF2254945.1 hypothetical protein BU26DRAFT_514777 [Trematosphaeria pertusa]
MFQDMSPTIGLTYVPAGNAPPTPPQNDTLDDIYGSAPSSPLLASHDTNRTNPRSEEILSDLPSRQRALDTDAYREGLANSKGQFIQEGFDEGYSLGANLGLLVGYILGALQGFVAALRGHDEARWKDAKGMLEDAQRELAMQELLNQKWLDQEGIWKWEVEGKEEEVTFREVAEQHPVVRMWIEKVGQTARELGVELEAVERSRQTEMDAAEAS